MVYQPPAPNKRIECRVILIPDMPTAAHSAMMSDTLEAWLNDGFTPLIYTTRYIVFTKESIEESDVQNAP